MKRIQHSPWLIITLVIVGMVIGYSLVIHPGIGTSTASQATCPHKELCNNGEDCGCDGTNCKRENCTGDCPNHGA